MPKGRLVFDGDNIYTEKDARVYKLKTSVSSKIDAIPGVVDSLDSTSTTDALSANMGRTLQDQINSLSGIGKFLSTWDCTTGLPGTNPQEDPYTYKVGDYYVVSTVGSTNYKPHGGTYTQGVPSTTVELENVGINDKYYFDGADWVRIPDTAIQISIDSTLSTTSTNAVENRAITNAINTKQDIISDLNTIRSGAASGATALQKLDNISELTNNIGYQTAGDVTSIVNNAINTLAPDGVGTGVLTLQKNATTVDTFSANATQDKTINITVPTTVAELSDANNYATKTYVDNAVDGLIHEGSTQPANPQEGDLWYDTVNHVLKIYNGTNWETVDTDTDTRYTAGNGINISAQNVISADTSVVATQNDLAGKANISDIPTTVAELSDASDYATKTYADSVAGDVVSDSVFSSAWDGDTTHAPSKNAVYDKMHSIEGDISQLQTDVSNISQSMITVEGVSFGAFVTACTQAGTRHEVHYSNENIPGMWSETYTFRGIGWFWIREFHGANAAASIYINGTTVLYENTGSGAYTVKERIGPFTMGAGDTVTFNCTAGGSSGTVKATVYDYY